MKHLFSIFLKSYYKSNPIKRLKYFRIPNTSNYLIDKKKVNISLLFYKFVNISRVCELIWPKKLNLTLPITVVKY